MRQGRIIIALILPILLSACLPESQAANAVAFETTFSGQGMYSGLPGNKKIEFFRSQANYETAVATYSVDPVAAVDFSGSQVVLLNMGSKPSSGYDIRVDSIAETNGVLTIYVTETYPDPSCMVLAVITKPYIFVRLFSTAEVETITIRQETANCNTP